MRLFYTGAKSHNAPQLVSEQSIGGLISSSAVPNDFLNNVFDDVSLLSLQTPTKDTRGFALKNELGARVSDIIMYVVLPENCRYDVEIAPVAVGVDDCNKPFMEQLPNNKSTPLSGRFYRPIVKYAEAYLTINTPGNQGDVFTVYINDEAVCTTEPLSAVYPTSEQTADALVAAFANHDLYEAWKELPANATKYEVTLRSKLPGILTSEVLVDTEGGGYVEPGIFQGAIDNAVNIGDLAAGKYLGLWVRKTLKSGYDKPLSDLELESPKPLEDQTIQLFLEWS